MTLPGALRLWSVGCVAVLAAIPLTALFEVLFVDEHEFRYLATFLVGYVGIGSWAIVGLGVALSAPARRRWPAADDIVRAVVALTLIVGLATWIALLAVG